MLAAESTFSNSPHAVYRRFRQAMADQDWAAEYLCYADEFQNRLPYRVVLLALHLEFDMDLFLQAEEVLERYGLTDAELEPFWPNAKSRVLVFAGDAPTPLERWESEIQARMDRWSKEFRPRVRDGAQLIAELQPLIVASGKRHPTSAGKEGCGGCYGGLDPAVECRLQSVDPNCYTEIWQAASELQMISDTLPKHRFAVIGSVTLTLLLNPSRTRDNYLINLRAHGSSYYWRQLPSYVTF